MNVQDIRSTIEQHREQLRSFGLRRVGIFGSLTQGTATSTSDIDLLLDFDAGKKTYRNYLGGTEYLETLLKRTVDAVTPQSVSPYIKPYIDRTVTYVQIVD